MLCALTSQDMTYQGIGPRETATFEAETAQGAVANPQTPQWARHSGTPGTHNTLASGSHQGRIHRTGPHSANVLTQQTSSLSSGMSSRSSSSRERGERRAAGGAAGRAEDEEVEEQVPEARRERLDAAQREQADGEQREHEHMRMGSWHLQLAPAHTT